MKNIIVLLHLFLLQNICGLVNAQTTYYVSASGDDTNNGTSPLTPWKTINKVNSVTFVSGDGIKFRGVDTFFGQIQLNQSNLTIEGYNAEVQKPVITGAIRITGWEIYNGSIYVAQVSSPIKNLFVDGVQMTIARYPNTGFLYIETVNGTTQFTAQGIDREPDYWNGATARIRTSNYTFEMKIVASYNGTTITLQSGTAYLRAGYGFYLDNKLSELDAPSEWYFDTENNKIYFYPPNGVDPNTLNIYGSCLDYGVTSSQSNITIKNLTFLYQIQSAIRFSGTTNNVKILSNDFLYGMINGIQVDGSSSHYTINGNKLTGFNGRGIVFANTTQTTISVT